MIVSSHLFSTGFALLAGSTATLVPKVLLQQECDDSCGRGPLNAPFLATLVVFIASSLGLVIELFTRQATVSKADSTGSSKQLLLGDEDDENADADAEAATVPATVAAAASPSEPRWWSYRRIILPGVFAVAGTLCQLAALMFISAAALAGLRGVFILLTACASAGMRLKDAPLSRKEWALILLAAAGAVCVGVGAELQAVLYPAASAGDSGGEGGGALLLTGAPGVALGLGLCCLGYAIASGQVAIESVFLANASFSRWEILGVEGVVGVALLVPVLGLLQLQGGGGGGGGPLEQPSRDLCCLRTPSILALCFAYGASSLTFNAALLKLNAVGPNWRVFVFTARGLLTWAVEAALAYSTDAAIAGLGNALSPVTPLTLAGFGMLIGGGVARAQENARMQAAAAAAATGAVGAAAGGSSTTEGEAADDEDHR